MNVAYSIASYQLDIGFGGGVESVPIQYINNLADGEKVSEEVFNNSKAANWIIPIEITPENVAEQFKIDRKSQDSLANDSRRKAAAAQKNGWSKDEIVTVKQK